MEIKKAMLQTFTHFTVGYMHHTELSPFTFRLTQNNRESSAILPVAESHLSAGEM